MVSSSNAVVSAAASAAVVIVIAASLIQNVQGSPLDPLKRGRTASSSLIPFPRVGRSVEESSGGVGGARLYYGQKRTGKSSLIPFPRVGKRATLSQQQQQQRGAFDFGPEALGEMDHLRDFYTKKTKENIDAELSLLVPEIKSLIQLLHEDEYLQQEMSKKSY